MDTSNKTGRIGTFIKKISTDIDGNEYWQIELDMAGIEKLSLEDTLELLRKFKCVS